MVLTSFSSFGNSPPRLLDRDAYNFLRYVTVITPVITAWFMFHSDGVIHNEWTGAARFMLQTVFLTNLWCVIEHHRSMSRSQLVLRVNQLAVGFCLYQFGFEIYYNKTSYSRDFDHATTIWYLGYFVFSWFAYFKK